MSKTYKKGLSATIIAEEQSGRKDRLVKQFADIVDISLSDMLS